MRTFSNRTARLAGTITASIGLTLLGAAAASAHVGLTPDSTSEGDFTQLVFRVPNESSSAKTSSITVNLPTDVPFTSVSLKPLEGWKAEVMEAELPVPITVNGATITKAAISVTWSADEAHQLKDHEYQTFSISVGRLPPSGTTVILPAAQTYTDGTVVKWNEPPADGRDESSHPAPAFVTTAPRHGAGETVSVATASDTTPTPDPTSAAANWTGLAAGILGLAAGLTALIRSGRTTKS